MTPLFDARKIHFQRQKAMAHLEDYNFLARTIEEELLARAQSLEQVFTDILINGARTDTLMHSWSTDSHLSYLNCYYSSTYSSMSWLVDEKDAIPFPDQSFDLVIDVLTLHTVNHVPHALNEFQRILKPQGVYIGAFYGGETLRELRESFLQAELAHCNGASLRVIPMISLETALTLLQKTGFNEPIADCEINTISYKSFKKILSDIKGMGEHQPFATSPSLLTYQQFKNAERFYQENYSNVENSTLKATVEIIFLKGSSPL